MNADDLLVPPPGDFDGRVTLVSEDDAAFAPGLTLELRRLRAGESARERDPRESAWLLLAGAGDVASGGPATAVARHSLFDAAPWTLHVPANTEVAVSARELSEWAVLRATNPRPFAPRLFRPDECEREIRGRGLAQGACEREVRLVFDRAARPASAMVLGEVVTYPGKWSSYPPHAHPQSEVYHYRTDRPEGYGHAECGERVFRVRSGHTLRIPGGLTHAQAAAPGYALWYLWAVRHLPHAPYEGFATEPAHAWILDPARQGWRPAS